MIIEWVGYFVLVLVALWAATGITEQRLIGPGQAVTGYFVRLGSLRRPSFRLREGDLSWEQTKLCRWEWLMITFLVLFFLSPAVTLEGNWQTLLELSWLVVAARLAYVRNIRHPSGSLGYFMLGAFALAGLFYLFVLWCMLGNKDIALYGFGMAVGYMFWPVPEPEDGSQSHSVT